MPLSAARHRLVPTRSFLAKATIFGSAVLVGVRKNRQWTASAAVGICAAVAIWTPDPDRYQRSLVSLHDFLHVPGFIVVMGALLFGFGQSFGASRAQRMLRLLGICVVAGAVGVGIELAQGATGGSADPWDVVRDCGGIAIAALFAVSRWSEVRAPARWLFRSAALAIALGFFVPTLGALADEARARGQFPVLADFGIPSEITRFTWSAWSSAVVERTGLPDDNQRRLRLSLSPGQYPGFSFEFFPRDWRGWGHFVIACTNPGDTPLLLTIRINDIAHNQEYTDRYNRTFSLVPGPNEIRVPLADVESAPRTRKLDLAHVGLVVAFAYELREPHELLIHQLRLAP